MAFVTYVYNVQKFFVQSFYSYKHYRGLILKFFKGLDFHFIL